MGWKDFSYVKKGMLIGGLVGFLIGWGFWVLFGVCNGFAHSNSCSFITSIIWIGNIMSGVMILIPGIIFGTLIGWIVGKIKSKTVE